MSSKNRSRYRLATAVLGTLTLGSAAHASTVFTENFDTAARGLSFSTTFDSQVASFTVTDDNVDVIGFKPAGSPYPDKVTGNGGWGTPVAGSGYFDFIPGNGVYVDLSGTAPTADNSKTGGEISRSFATTAGGKYSVSFDLASSNGSQLADVSIDGSVIASIVTSNMSSFDTYTYTFTATGTTTTLSFGARDNTTNQGALLDRVIVNAVPVPPAVFGGATVLGMAGAGMFLKRRRALA